MAVVADPFICTVFKSWTAACFIEIYTRRSHDSYLIKEYHENWFPRSIDELYYMQKDIHNEAHLRTLKPFTFFQPNA